MAIHKFNIVCISETHLDSSPPSDDNNLEISEFNLVHSDHPLRNERGGVFVFYQSFLSLRILNVQYLQEGVCFELKISDKTCKNHLSSKRKATFSRTLFFD